MFSLRQLFHAGLLASAATAASAATINIDSITSSWHSTVGGVGVTENVSHGRYELDPSDGFNQVRWGTPFMASPTSGKSGLGIQTYAPLANVGLDTAIDLGLLRHYNWTISGGTAATATNLDLSIGLSIDGNPLAVGPLTSSMAIDETPNVEGSCAYPSVVPCSDKITISGIGSSSVFTIDAMEYTFKLFAFGPTLGSLTDNFISQEGSNSDAHVWGIITSRLSCGTPAECGGGTVPEPGTLALLGLAALGAGWTRRRNVRG